MQEEGYIRLLNQKQVTSEEASPGIRHFAEAQELVQPAVRQAWRQQPQIWQELRTESAADGFWS